jgi:glutamate 5-kinase
MLIARGVPGDEPYRGMGPLAAIEAGARSTLFVPREEPLSARKAWIAAAINPAGAIIVDAGAQGALRRGKSLLAAGIAGVDGSFERGDAVVIRSPSGSEIGRGLSAYASDEIRAIAGHKSGEIAGILGYRGRDEIIHRDDLVVAR